MRNKSIFLVIFIFSLKFSFAQKDFKSAEKMFQQGHFFDALQDYKKAFASSKSEEQKLTIEFKTAECYRHLGDYKQAEEWYAKAIEGNYSDDMAIIYLAELQNRKS
jgi:tetratricopeptide (TPR) repeat protein